VSLASRAGALMSLGRGASLETFTPGMDGTYSASATANVILTAGDAALSVTGPERNVHRPAGRRHVRAVSAPTPARR
jgi:hypothetical protein